MMQLRLSTRLTKFSLFVICASVLVTLIHATTTTHELNNFFIDKNENTNTDPLDTYKNVKFKEEESDSKKSILLNQNFNLEFDRFDTQQNYDNLTFVYGLHSTVWILGKSEPTGSNLYVSRDNGATFSLFKNKLMRGHTIDNVYSSQFHLFNVFNRTFWTVFSLIIK